MLLLSLKVVKILVLAVMVTVRLNFSAVTNAVATFSDHLAAIIFTTVSHRKPQFYKQHLAEIGKNHSTYFQNKQKKKYVYKSEDENEKKFT